MLKSFKYAGQGIRDAIKSEANLSVHLLYGIVALIFAYFLGFSNVEFAILSISISLVIILEFINTAIEKIVDLHSIKVSEQARQIKDISAAVVLLSALAAIVIGAFLFIPKFLN